MKYVVARVYKNRKLFLDVPFVFPELVVHSVAFEGFRSALLAQYPVKDGYTVKPLSAGFVNSMDLIDIRCTGNSTTLEVASRGVEDDNLLRMADYGSCMQPSGKPKPYRRERCKATNLRGNCACGLGQCIRGNVL